MLVIAKTYKEYIENLNSVWKECIRVLTPDGKICINIMPMFLSGKETVFERRVTKTAIMILKILWILLVRCICTPYIFGTKEKS